MRNRSSFIVLVCLLTCARSVSADLAGVTSVTPTSDAFDTSNFLGTTWSSILGSSASTAVSSANSGQIDFLSRSGATTSFGSDGKWDIQIEYSELQADFPRQVTAGDRMTAQFIGSQGPSGSADGAFQLNDQVEGGAAFGSRNIQQLTVTFGPGMHVDAEDIEIFHSSLNSNGDRHEWASIQIVSAATASWSAPGASSFLGELYDVQAGSALSNGSTSPGQGGAGGEDGSITGWFFATDDNTDSGSAANQGGTAKTVGAGSVANGGAFTYVGSATPGAETGTDGLANSGSFTGTDTGLATGTQITGFVYTQYVDEIDSFTGDSDGPYVTRLDFGFSNIQAVPEPSGFLFLSLICLLCSGLRRWNGCIGS